MHHNDFYDSVKTRSLGKIWFLSYVKMLTANLKNYWRYEVDFLHACTYLLKLQIDDVTLGGHVQACPDMPKEAFKTLRSKKIIEV